MNGKRIENEEQFDKAQRWLVETAYELEDPLCSLTPEERAKKMAVFDRTGELIQRYLRSQTMKTFPEMRRIYDQLGWEYDVFDDEPEQKKEEKQSTSALTDWLDG